MTGALAILRSVKTMPSMARRRGLSQHVNIANGQAHATFSKQQPAAARGTSALVYRCTQPCQVRSCPATPAPSLSAQH